MLLHFLLPLSNVCVVVSEFKVGVNTYMSVRICVCFPELAYRVPTLKQIQQGVMLKDGPRETPRREERERNVK